jgi:glycosyltransferase involved in cell wall biosynthesis
MMRNLRALGLVLAKRWDVVVIHDPETIPAGVIARLIRRKPIVFDVHENLPAQIASKEWIPDRAKPLFRASARGLYRLAERFLVLTLAEPGYRDLFRNDHPVFPNYPRSTGFPTPGGSGNGSAVYVGDITRARGIEDALEASGQAGVSLLAVGRVDPILAGTLLARAEALGVDLELTGHLPNPEAVQRISAASVGLSPLRDEPNYRFSLPTKTLEYLAMGVPVVATDLPGTRAVIGELSSVALVPPGDIAAMSTAISQALHPQARAEAVEQAARVRREFSWPEDSVRAFYSGLFNREGSRDPS